VIDGTNSIEFVGHSARNNSLENNGGNQTLFNNLTGGATLSFSTRNVFLAASGDGTGRIFTLAGPGTTNINVPIVNGGTQANALIYAGVGGSLNLSGISTYTGATILSGGTTTLYSSGGHLNTTASITVNQGAALTLDNFNTINGVLGANPAGGTISGMSTTSGSTTVTVTDTTGLVAGMAVNGPGIPAGAVINSVTNGTQFVISANASAVEQSRPESQWRHSESNRWSNRNDGRCRGQYHGGAYRRCRAIIPECHQ
jgi:hypothetical protein